MRLTRRQLLKSSIAATGAAGVAALGLDRYFREPSAPDFPVRLLGPSAKAGHRLRDGFQFPQAKEVVDVDTLIIGGGIAGLSAGWRLQKHGVTNFKILELESEVGGNSRHGGNEVSKFPWGAHYVTLLNDEAIYAREMFEDFGVITGARNGKSTYNEYYLCNAPHERLYMYQRWQDGLLPKTGVSPDDDAQASAFFAHVETLRSAKGSDGLYAFTIPLALSSKDPNFLSLDQMTMADYMTKNGWQSKTLNWYVDYCCRDDYGAPHSQVSAWAGLHYFSSRRGRADGVDGSAVITWPEGNGWLVDQLRDRLKKHVVTDSMAIKLDQSTSEVRAAIWNERSETVTTYRAKSVVMAIPRFVAAHLEISQEQNTIAREVSYSPWLVANLTLKNLPKESAGGATLSWDNVFFEGRSLGYVVATHQRTTIHTDATVLTYYRPLDHLPPADARKEAASFSATQWRDLILRDFSEAHPDIPNLISSMDVWVWGHAMARPVPGFVTSTARKRMHEPVGRIHFAHSDMSGISIFEEANYHGVRAADEVLKNARV